MAILESEICGHGREVISGCNLCDGLQIAKDKGKLLRTNPINTAGKKKQPSC